MKKAILAAMFCAIAAAPSYAKEYVSEPEEMASRLIEKMDRNGDGLVSMEEHENFSAAMFSNVDANGDRLLSQDELAAYKMVKQEQRAEQKEPRNGAYYRQNQ